MTHNQRFSAFRGVLAVLLAGVSLSLSEPAWADPPHPPRRPQVAESPRVSSSISVEMKCVRGTNDNARVDESLKSILPALSQTNYRGFSLVDSYRDNLSDGQETEFSIEGGRKVKIELLDHDQTKARVRIRMFNGQGRQALDTTVSIHRDRSFMVAGPKVGDDVLILPVTVRY